jgi:hypothetical protein
MRHSCLAKISRARTTCRTAWVNLVSYTRSTSHTERQKSLSHSSSIGRSRLVIEAVRDPPT